MVYQFVVSPVAARGDEVLLDKGMLCQVVVSEELQTVVHVFVNQFEILKLVAVVRLQSEQRVKDLWVQTDADWNAFEESLA